MTYGPEVRALAETMRDLLTERGPIDPGDVDVVLTAHATLTRLLQTLHTDLANVRAADQTSAAAVEQHPVAVHARLLQDHPRHAPLPLTEVIDSRPTTPAGQSWRQAARHAVLAQHDWQTSTPTSRPAGDATWSDLADVAALSEALAYLDADLGRQLTAAGRPDLAAPYTDAAHSGLATTARAVQQLAASGATPHPTELDPSPQRALVAVRTDADLPAATQRLAHLLTTTRELTPVHVQLIAGTLARASLSATGPLAAPSNDQASALAAALHRQAAALGAVASAPRRVASLVPSQPGPLLQAQLLHDRLRRGGHLTPAQALPWPGPPARRWSASPTRSTARSRPTAGSPR